MKIDLYDIYYYYLTCNNKIRKEHIINEFKNFKLVEINPIMNIGKNKSGATGFSKILDQACIHQDKNKPFQPFVIFEDDIKKNDEFPLEIEVPNDTDILYIGLSSYGMTNKENGVNNSVCFKNIDDNIIRVYNMLSLHGIIVCSMRGLLTLQKCMFESYFKDKIWDIYTCQIQPYLNVYSLKKPLIYQYGKIGGQEIPTKINYIDRDDKPIPKEWINNDNLSVLTINQNELIPKDIIPTQKNSNIPNDINYLLKDLGPIQKKIHISWKTKNILDLDFNIIKNGIKKLKDLNPEYTFEISDNNDVEQFIKKHISNNDYNLIKDRNIVEKVDLWRLLKIYHEGGFYMDIDRLYNIPLKNIINSEHKCILPMHHDIDFSQDIMMSSSNNIIFKEAIDLNLKRRQEGCTDILSLGPISYFNAITKILLGNQIKRYPSKDNLIKLRTIISNCKYLSTFREVPPYNTLVYKGEHINFDKTHFYRYCDVSHWTKDNPNDSNNKPYGK